MSLENAGNEVGRLRAEVATLKQLLELYEGQVVRHVEELERRVVALAETNEQLQQFTSLAAHDLQEPLRTVSLYCSLLARHLGGNLEPKAAEAVRFIVEGAGRMSHMIESLLELSRLSGEENPFGPVSLDAVVDEALLNLSGKLRATAAVIHRVPLPEVRGSRAQLVRVFQNLFDNALKFRSEAPPRISLGAESREGRWRVTVSDNGVGIDPRFHPKMFQPFKRFHSRAKYSGSGIGLALCRKTLELHGGDISAVSAPGEGTSISLSFPA